MLEFLRVFYGFLADVCRSINVPVIGGVGLFEIVIASLVLFMIVSIFWKGARA